jgi:hypothetical protein
MLSPGLAGAEAQGIYTTAGDASLGIFVETESMDTAADTHFWFAQQDVDLTKLGGDQWGRRQSSR